MIEKRKAEKVSHADEISACKKQLDRGKIACNNTYKNRLESVEGREKLNSLPKILCDDAIELWRSQVIYHHTAIPQSVFLDS